MAVAVGRTLIAVATFIIFTSSSAYVVTATSSLLGIDPKDENFYKSDFIKCRDGSKSFSRERLNDDFCDCSDGTDEPGTSACPEGRFYCRNEGSTPQLLFSSRVNDHLCDCCDGSDEYDGSIICSNTCFKDGNVSRSAFLDDVHLQQKKSTVSLEDLVQKLKELKMIVFLEVVLIMLAFRLLHRHIRSRRRWYYQRNSYSWCASMASLIKKQRKHRREAAGRLLTGKTLWKINNRKRGDELLVLEALLNMILCAVLLNSMNEMLQESKLKKNRKLLFRLASFLWNV